MTQTYSLLKSRTFWVLVFMFLTNGFAAVSGQLNPTLVVVANILFTSLAAYFHLQTGLSTSGMNTSSTPTM